MDDLCVCVCVSLCVCVCVQRGRFPLQKTNAMRALLN